MDSEDFNDLLSSALNFKKNRCYKKFRVNI